MNQNIQNPVVIMVYNLHNNHDENQFFIINIATSHHDNHDVMSYLIASFIIRIMTFLIYHILGELAGRGCQPSNRQGSQWFALQLGGI